MELRKVQLTGGSSITVTLPKAWVEKLKIGAGDVVGCEQQPDGSLAIYPHARAERLPSLYEIEVDGEKSAFLFRRIIAAYLTGFDTIRLSARRGLDGAARQTIRKAVRRIIGLEITDEQPNSITIQDFLDPREFQLEKALRRMGMLCQAMQQEAHETLRQPSADAVKSAEDRDDEVDRLYWLASKQYHAILRDSTYGSKMGLNASQALNYLLAARLLERTADHADRITHEATQLTAFKGSQAFREKLAKEFKQASDLFLQALQNFHKRDARAANQVIEESYKFLEGQKRLLRDAADFGGEPASHLAFIIESIMRTAAYAADVAEVAINNKVASEDKLPASS
jgi:phosphate uptake regulator